MPARLLWVDADEKAADEGVVGVQDRSGDLVDGERKPDGSICYQVEVQLRPARSGVGNGLDFGGPYVHGVAGERFLYLSFRVPGGTGWRRRVKLMLPATAPVDSSGLSVRFRDVGKVRAVLDDPGWTTE